MRAIAYRPADADRWDTFVDQSAQGTFLHTRRFLGYHGDRFRDCSFMFEDERGELQAVLPAAQSSADPHVVVSHPGITYGGLLHRPRCAPVDVHAMLASAAEHLARLGYRVLQYRTVPSPVQRTCVQADLYALWLIGARLTRRDLWNVVALRDERHPASRHLRDERRARGMGLQAVLAESDQDHADFHGLLTESLALHHQVAPVHSLQDMLLIRSLFPRQVELWVCRAPDGGLLAGIWMFRLHALCWHTQYVAANERGRTCFATDFLLAAVAQAAAEQGARHLTQGTSTQDAGKVLNDSLFRFKSGIGAGSIAHDFYDLDLALAAPPGPAPAGPFPG